MQSNASTSCSAPVQHQQAPGPLLFSTPPHPLSSSPRKLGKARNGKQWNRKARSSVIEAVFVFLVVVVVSAY
ncbi:hypothetical protein M758_1G299400 [Ceratodon purpureus]|nr:hypothetical protein M758_1G299400 [Ceratodon purpureus]